MADQFVQVNAGTGPKIDVSELTVAGNVVERQRVVIADDAVAGNVATVKAPNAAVVAADEPLAVGLHPSSPVPLPPLTKGVQGATGLTVQRLQDAGRSNWNVYAEAVAGVVADTLVPLLVSVGFAAPGASATSYTVPAGKTLRIVSLTATVVATATTPLFTSRIRVRVNTAGAAAINSPLVWSVRLGLPSATAAILTSYSLTVPFVDGMEIPAGAGIAVSHFESTATGTLDVALDGFLY